MITADCDTKTQFEFCVAELLKVFNPEDISFRVSSGGKGFHVKVECDIPFDEELLVRRAIWDDVGRIAMDEVRHAHGMETGKLFAWKNGKQSGAWKKWSRNGME